MSSGHGPLFGYIGTSAIVGHVPDSGELLIHLFHIFWANRHCDKGIHRKSGMAAYQGGVVTGGICIVIILSCVTNGHMFFWFLVFGLL